MIAFFRVFPNARSAKKFFNLLPGSMQYLAVAEVYRKLAIASSGGGALLVIRMLGYWL
jgi:hypothetical protein